MRNCKIVELKAFHIARVLSAERLMKMPLIFDVCRSGASACQGKPQTMLKFLYLNLVCNLFPALWPDSTVEIFLYDNSKLLA